MRQRDDQQTKQRARSLRQNQTESERILWSVLRGKQVSGLKFRRQHPIGPFFADFACVSRKLVVEIDGGVHEMRVESDLQRESFLRSEGWDIIRFSDREVIADAELVAIGIARHLGFRYEYQGRSGTGSGMESKKSRVAKRRRTLPGP